MSTSERLGRRRRSTRGDGCVPLGITFGKRRVCTCLSPRRLAAFAVRCRMERSSRSSLKAKAKTRPLRLSSPRANCPGDALGGDSASGPRRSRGSALRSRRRTLCSGGGRCCPAPRAPYRWRCPISSHPSDCADGTGHGRHGPGIRRIRGRWRGTPGRLGACRSSSAPADPRTAPYWRPHFVRYICRCRQFWRHRVLDSLLVSRLL